MKRVIVAASGIAAGALVALSVIAAPPKGAHGSGAGDAPTVQTLGGLEKNM